MDRTVSPSGASDRLGHHGRDWNGKADAWHNTVCRRNRHRRESFRQERDDALRGERRADQGVRWKPRSECVPPEPLAQCCSCVLVPDSTAGGGTGYVKNVTFEDFYGAPLYPPRGHVELIHGTSLRRRRPNRH